MRYLHLILILMLCLLTECIVSQQKLELDGQASIIGNFSPDNPLEILAGGRYIPKLSFNIPLDSIKTIDLEASLNISGSVLFHPFDTSNTAGSLDPYRIWARYSGEQFEIRAGLQKIDFGSATLLRPIQWFNQIDPRDPLQLTNGVYGILGRYYFLNNANIWLWVLYGNEKTRGFDAIETNKKIPEIGGRIQYPVPKGEIAFSSHYRIASSTHLDFIPKYERIPETKIGIDGKWDLTVGLWFEAVFSHKSKALDLFTNQTYFNVGTDYTFGLGNGLNLIVEHLLTSFDRDPFSFENTANISAVIASYPLGFFDRISTIYYYSWKGNNSTFFLNYEHQFENITGYLMAYYNPEVPQGIQQNDLIYNFSGPGIRIMFVYNH